jgi:hypothetical protein
MVVHHIEVDEVSPGGNDARNFFAQAGEIG